MEEAYALGKNILEFLQGLKENGFGYDPFTKVVHRISDKTYFGRIQEQGIEKFFRITLGAKDKEFAEEENKLLRILEKLNFEKKP